MYPNLPSLSLCVLMQRSLCAHEPGVFAFERKSVLQLDRFARMGLETVIINRSHKEQITNRKRQTIIAVQMCQKEVPAVIRCNKQQLVVVIGIIAVDELLTAF